MTTQDILKLELLESYGINNHNLLKIIIDHSTPYQVKKNERLEREIQLLKEEINRLEESNKILQEGGAKLMKICIESLYAYKKPAKLCAIAKRIWESDD